MKYLALLLIFGFGLSGSLGQTIKSLGYNTTNGQVVANTGTNVLTFTNDVSFANGELDISGNTISGPNNSLSFEDGTFAGSLYMDGGNIQFSAASNAATTRANLGVAPAPIFKVLTNDFSITNQTNMTVVNGLTITTEANKNYIFELLPILSANSGSTIMQIVGSNATVYGYWLGQNVAVISTNSLTNEFSVSIASARSFFQKFHVIAGTNSGSISFQFKNSTNNNTNTIGAGSYMMAQEILVTP